MLFMSIIFLIFTTLVFILYYLPYLRKHQVHILIIASLFFYGYNNPLNIIILIVSIIINTVLSYEIYNHKRRALLLTVLGIMANVLMLSLFKYNKFFSAALMQNSIIPDHISKQFISLPLPLGISYFTFQGVSLLIDTCRQVNEKSNENIKIISFREHLINSTLFLTFFPKQASGPIITAHRFFPQINEKFLQSLDWRSIFKFITIGLFLKMVIADNLKDYTFWMRYPEFTALSSIDLIVLLYAYAFQFFADFAGYSLIAIGIGHLFGYTLPPNFNYPYIAASLSDFWSRWHISLSGWLRDYLYIPLGGNRKGEIKTYINLFIVMVVAGAWHGATLNFIFWGIWHGGGLVAGSIIKNYFRPGNNKKSPAIMAVKIFIIFNFVSAGWLFFVFPEIAHVYAYGASIIGNIHIKPNVKFILPMLIYSSPVVMYHIYYFLRNMGKFQLLHKIDYAFYGLLLFFILLNKGDGNAFIYFQF